MDTATLTRLNSKNREARLVWRISSGNTAIIMGISWGSNAALVDSSIPVCRGVDKRNKAANAPIKEKALFCTSKI